MSSESAKRIAHAATWLSAALFVLTFASPTWAQYVKDIEGKWLLDGQALKRGQTLPAGGRITFDPSAAPSGLITIGDNNARSVVHKR